MTSTDQSFDQTADVLRYLRVFLAVAGSGSVSRSAERIYKAPSAITRSLTQLEQALGQELFERKPRGMLLNSYGEAVLTRARRIQEEIEAAATELCQRPGHNVASLTPLLMSGRKLQLFVALAEHGHLAAVSRQMKLSRSGISMALARLEEALGQPLFQRMAQGMVTTDAAARLLLHAKRAFSEMRHIQADLSALQGSLHGTITIGALPLCRTRLLPVAIAQLLAKYPLLKIKTFESPYDELAKGLRCGDIDFIFGALRAGQEGHDLSSEPLFNDSVGLFCRKDHPLTRQVSAIVLGQIAREKWILPRQDSPARQVLNQAFMDNGLAIPEPSVETGDLAILRNLLTHTDLITATSPHQLHDEIESGLVVRLPVLLAGTERQIGMTQRHGALPSPAITALQEEIRDVVRTAMPGQP
ncbi:MAG TPA: LysR family transcriptional regulator [Rhodanobacter sp.]|nr:LysR family transcriptional regulator [Rhodanobacter sp.]